MTRIGFLGPEGSFSHEAAINYFGNRFEPAPQDSFLRVFNALKKGECRYIIVPIDNSIEGFVTQVADVLYQSDAFIIIGECVFDIKQNLLVVPGTSIGDIERIYSHPQALGQCRGYIEGLRGNRAIEEIATKSTAEGAEIVAGLNGRPPLSAAIGTKLSARLNNLLVVAEDIADADNNQTSFLIITTNSASAVDYPNASNNCSNNYKTYKTFIIFSVENRPGALVRVLEVFDVLAVNMTMIQSRPSKKRLGEYIFFVEFEGHMASPNIAVALGKVRSRSVWLKVLGSYPIYKPVHKQNRRS